MVIIVITLPRFTAPEDTCTYLPEQQERLEYEVALRMTPAEYENRMNAGWRKFGRILFHPVCRACTECRPLRIDATRFTPDRSQRRALARCEDLRVETGLPRVDDVRLDLYRRYHAHQAARKGWPETEKDAHSYRQSFCDSPIPMVEVTLWEGETLRAVTINDLTPNVVSGVYHFYDPDARDAAGRDRGLGTVAVMQTILLAQQLGRAWAYFGFYVADCSSLSYKARFHPCELLGTDGVWREYPRATA